MAFTPLNALHAFLAVARQRSFHAAARELGISPSALSQSVRQLEVRLGTPLLTRTTRSVALTDAGRRLLEGAGPGVNQALESLRNACSQPGEVTGRVRLTVPRIAVAPLVVPIVPAFLRRHPRVEVDVRVEDRLVDIVAEGYDAGIRLTEAIERDMVQVRLSDSFRFLVVAAPSYLARKGTPQHPRDLLDHDCITYRSPTTGAPYLWELERGRQSWRVPVRGAVNTDDTTTMLAMAEAGLGLAYTSEPSVQPQLTRGSLRPVLEAYAAEVPGFFLYFPSRAQVSPAFRAFVDVAREVVRGSSRRALRTDRAAGATRSVRPRD